MNPRNLVSTLILTALVAGAWSPGTQAAETSSE
jgi:hypothetical protein